MLYHPDVPSKLFSCFLLVVALACAARAQDGGAAPTLRGVVVDQHGAPVEGARVSLLGVGAVDAVVVSTDAGGRFAFGPVRLDGSLLTARAGGFETFERRWKAAEWDGREELRVVLLPATFAERVTVTAARAETRLA